MQFDYTTTSGNVESTLYIYKGTVTNTTMVLCSFLTLDMVRIVTVLPIDSTGQDFRALRQHRITFTLVLNRRGTVLRVSKDITFISEESIFVRSVRDKSSLIMIRDGSRVCGFLGNHSSDV